MAQYQTGSVDVVNGLPTVTGHGTSWLTEIVAGQLFSIKNENVWYTVASIENDGHLTLTSTYTGSTANGAGYAIQRDFTPNNSFATPSYGDVNISSLMRDTLLRLDTKLASFSPLAAALNGDVSVNGDLDILLNGNMTLNGVAYAPVVETMGRRQTVWGGPITTNGVPNYLPAISDTLSLTTVNITTSSPLLATAAKGFNGNGKLDHFFKATANLTWSGLPASSTVYLYVNAETGVLGHTTIAPIYQFYGAPSLTVGAFVFNISEMSGYLGDGANANKTAIVFVGEATTSATGVTAVTSYSYNGVYIGPWTAIPTTTGLKTINHNLGCGAYGGRVTVMAKALVANYGYVVDDVTPLLTGAAPYAPPSTIIRRNVAGWYQGATSIGVVNLSTGANALATSTHWNYRVEVDRGW